MQWYMRDIYYMVLTCQWLPYTGIETETHAELKISLLHMTDKKQLRPGGAGDAPQLNMKENMKKLLIHLQKGEYSTEDAVTIMANLRDCIQARIDFLKSETPESEALARWRMNDARKKWRETCDTYSLPKHEPDSLF